MHCKKCGHALGTNSMVCPRCGAMLDIDQLKDQKKIKDEKQNQNNFQLLSEKYGQKNNIEYSTEKKNSEYYKFYIICAILVIIIIIAVFILI